MSDLPPGVVLDQTGLPPGVVLDVDRPNLKKMLDEAPSITDYSGGLDALAKALPGMTNAAGEAATFGLAGPVSAAGRALIQPMLPGGSDGSTFGERYFRNMVQQRGEGDKFSAENPGLSALSTAAGYMTPVAPVLGAAGAIAPAIAPTLGRMALGGATTGAGVGAATGLSESPRTDALGLAKDTGIGAGVGALVGGALPVAASAATPLAQALARQFNPNAVSQQAAQLIGGRISQDMAAGGPDAAAMALRLHANPNLSLMDVGGENTQALAGRMSRMQGEPRQIVTDFLNQRDAEAGNRLTAAVDAHIASGGPTFTTGQQLMQQRAQQTAPLWQKFYVAPPLNPDAIAPGGALDNMMTRPAMVKAANNALNLAKEEGRNPASLGITFNEAGDPKFEAVPSWQTLDYVKRGLDDVLNSHRDSTTGRLVRDESVNAIEKTMQGFRDFMDANNPAYAPARAAWSGPSQSLAAMKMGGGFASMAPDRIAYEISRLDPGDQAFYRLGAANTLKSQIAGKGPGGNEALALMGNKTRQDQLAAIFPDQTSFQQFMDQVARPEGQMFQTRQNVIGGSPTGRRVAEDQGGSFARDIAAPLAVSIAAGHPTPMLSLLPRIGAFLHGETSNPAVNTAAARMMASSDPATNMATLAQILARRAPLSPAIGAPASALGASVYPRLEFSPGQ